MFLVLVGILELSKKCQAGYDANWERQVVDMCKAVQDMNNMAKQEGKKEMAFKLHDEENFSFEKIASVASESLSTVQRWFTERSTAVNWP